MPAKKKGKKGVDDPAEGAAQEPFEEKGVEDPPEGAAQEPFEEKDAADEPFTAKPSAQVLAGLYRHAKAEHDYVDSALPGMDHPGVSEALKDAYADGNRPTMDGLKDILGEHHPDHDMDKILKDMDGSAKVETGEANLVDANEIPDTEAMEEDKDAGQEPFESGTGPEQKDEEETPATEEILERYQMPGGKGWGVKVIGRVRRTKGGKSYLVRTKEMCPECGNSPCTCSKDLTDEGNPAELTQGPHGPGEGQIIKAEHLDAVKDTADGLTEMAMAGDMPGHHGRALKMHAKNLLGLHKDLSMPADAGTGAGPELSNPGNPTELKGGGPCEACSGTGESSPGRKCPVCSGSGEMKSIEKSGNHKRLEDTVVGQELNGNLAAMQRMLKQRCGINVN